MTKFFALLCLMLCLSGFQANSQSRQVSGKVSDIKTNEPLIGVSVRLKGTNAGTSTDVSGNFRLTITGSNPVLSVSYTGYQSKEVPVGSQQTFDIKLQEDAQALDEVVVVGYGTQRKSQVATAVASVSGEAIAERGTVSALQGAQGQVAGVDISQGSGRAGGGYNIQIRGQNSLAGGQPLYVVDGVIVPDINFLNPQDIFKLDILKDAA